MIERADSHRRIVALVLELDEPHRGILLRRYFDGEQPREIARRVGCPVSTISNRLTRAHAALRRRLSREGDSEEWISLLTPVLAVPAAGSGSVGIAALSVLFSKPLAGAIAAVIVLGLGWITWQPFRPAPDPGGPVPLGQAEPDDPPPTSPGDAASVNRTVVAGEVVRTGRLRGRIVDRVGNPVTGARLTVVATGGKRWQADSDVWARPTRMSVSPSSQRLDCDWSTPRPLRSTCASTPVSTSTTIG